MAIGFLLLLYVSGCSDSNGYLIDLSPESLPKAGTWLVDENYIQWGCPGKDCIPNLTNPEVVKPGSAHLSYLDDEELVVGIKRGEETYAFPHPILDWHEVINMDSYTISYCPLTGSAIHITNDQGFGVSGLLYNSNLIMYDKETNSFWPQMLLKSASGESRGERLILDTMVETTWGTWRSLFPDTYVVSSRTGHSRNYGAYPYGSFKTDGAIYFPIEKLDSRLHPKRRVVGVLSGSEAKAYAISDFDTVSIVHDAVGDENIVIFGSSTYNFAVAYKTASHFSVRTFDSEGGKIILTDDETGSEWNILGEAISGPQKGSMLDNAESFISYWFAWAAFYPETDLWEKE